MSLSEELTKDFIEHQGTTGNVPSKLRIHETLWQELKRELDDSGALRTTDGDIQDEPLQFNGASVTLVSKSEDPDGFFRWSIQ